MKPTRLVALFLGCSPLFAQTVVPATPPVNPPEQTFRVFQFPADKIPAIDGDDSDWKIVPESYAIKTDQLTDDTKKHGANDPKTLDVSVKVGWVKGLNRLYFLYEATDNFWDFSDPGLHNDTFELVVDGDYSGGPLVPRFRANPAQSEAAAKRTMYGTTAQNYHIFTPAVEKDWAMEYGCQPWIKDLPWANHAQRFQFKHGESGKYVLEFWITPFDYAGCDGPQRAVESQLSEGMTLGISWAIIDYDGSPKSDGFWNLSREHTMYGNASFLRAFQLMPLLPEFVHPIAAHWTFKTLDYDRREVAFQDDSTGTVHTWSWDFGDGTSSNERNPVHRYAAAGDYVVVLKVTGPAGTSRFSRVWDVSFPR